MEKQSKTKYKVFGRIRECRNEKHLSLFDLAEAVGRSENHMGAIERGERACPDKMFQKIAEALDVRPEYLKEIDDFKTEEDVRRASDNLLIHRAVSSIEVHAEIHEAFDIYLKALGLTDKAADKKSGLTGDRVLVDGSGQIVKRFTFEQYEGFVSDVFNLVRYWISEKIREDE